MFNCTLDNLSIYSQPKNTLQWYSKLPCKLQQTKQWPVPCFHSKRHNRSLSGSSGQIYIHKPGAQGENAKQRSIKQAYKVCWRQPQMQGRAVLRWLLGCVRVVRVMIMVASLPNYTLVNHKGLNGLWRCSTINFLEKSRTWFIRTTWTSKKTLCLIYLYPSTSFPCGELRATQSGIKQ